MKLANIKRNESYTVYIGRGSPFGNPFSIGIDGSRSEVIEKFEQYAEHNKELKQAISELKEDDVLGCFCTPLSCHGSIIIKIWRQLKEVKNDK